MAHDVGILTPQHLTRGIHHPGDRGPHHGLGLPSGRPERAGESGRLCASKALDDLVDRFLLHDPEPERALQALAVSRLQGPEPVLHRPAVEHAAGDDLAKLEQGRGCKTDLEGDRALDDPTLETYLGLGDVDQIPNDLSLEPTHDRLA
jgi:hypothetical protein